MSVQKIIKTFLLSDKRNDLITPHYVEAKIRSKVTFTCPSDPRLSWKFNGLGLPRSVIQVNRHTVRVNSVEVKYNGLYECYGAKNTKGRVSYFVAKAELRVYGKQHKQDKKNLYLK